MKFRIRHYDNISKTVSCNLILLCIMHMTLWLMWVLRYSQWIINDLHRIFSPIKIVVYMCMHACMLFRDSGLFAHRLCKDECLVGIVDLIPFYVVAAQSHPDCFGWVELS